MLVLSECQHLTVTRVVLLLGIVKLTRNIELCRVVKMCKTEHTFGCSDTSVLMSIRVKHLDLRLPVSVDVSMCHILHH